MHLYMVTLHDGAEKPLPPFDVDGLEEALEHLILPSQALQFSTEAIDVSEDPALSIAVAGAMRGAAAVMVAPEGHVGSVVHRYLDARELSAHLRELNVRRAHRSAREVYTSSAASAGDSVLDVPVFVFSSTGREPLFLDEDLSVALSLPDMARCGPDTRADAVHTRPCTPHTVLAFCKGSSESDGRVCECCNRENRPLFPPTATAGDWRSERPRGVAAALYVRRGADPLEPAGPAESSGGGDSRAHWRGAADAQGAPDPLSLSPNSSRFPGVSEFAAQG